MTSPDADRTILVVAAMPIELRPFTRALKLTRTTVGGVTTYRGTLPGTDLTVLAALTGVGPARATASTKTLLAAVRVGRLVMIGIAGGLDPSLQIGDLVVPDAVIDLATGLEHRPDPVQAVTPKGKLLTSATIDSDGAARDRQLRDGVIALDMETAAVGAVCEQRGTPWSVFRTISDRVQDGIVDSSTLAMTKPDGSADVVAAANVILTRPTIVPKLARLARDTNRAVRIAAEVGVEECRAFARSLTTADTDTSTQPPAEP